VSDRSSNPSPWSAHSDRARPSAASPQQPPLEEDPTGVREILATLRDPGPMPPDLVQRITASLAAERALREQSLRDQARHDRAHQKSSGAAGAGDEPDDSGDGLPSRLAPAASVHSLAAAQERRRGPRQWPLLAAAASVVVLAGAVVMGILGVLNGGSFTTAAGDSSSLTSAQEAREADSAAGGAAEMATEAEEDSGEDASADDGAATMLSASVPVLSTGAVLTRDTLGEHAQTVADRAPWVPDTAVEQLAADSPINSSDGAADCLGVALDQPVAELAERIDAIDFVRYDGEPAGLILLRGGPRADAAPLTAYVVPADCGLSPPRLLDAPLPLAS